MLSTVHRPPSTFNYPLSTVQLPAFSVQCSTKEPRHEAGAHPVCDTAWQDGLDDDAGGPAADDAEAEAGAVVHQVNDLDLRPLGVQLPIGEGGGEGGFC